MKLEAWQRAERFIPLTYLESIRGRPLVVKLSDEWNFVAPLQTAINFVTLIDRKDFCAKLFDHYKNLPAETPTEKMGKHLGLLTAIKAMVEVLYDLSKGEYASEGLLSRVFRRPSKRQIAYHRFLNDHLLKNTDVMFDLWEKVLEHNSRLEKKNAVPDELQSPAKPRSLDKWRGFLHGRSAIGEKTFLTVLHEDEEETIKMIRQHRSQKEHEKKSKRMGAIHNRLPGLNRG